MDYVLIKNGQIVVEDELLHKDVLIGNNKIILIEDSIKRPEPETPIIDAKGKLLIPGAIDTNVFFTEIAVKEGGALQRFNHAQILCGTTTLLEPLFSVSSVNYKDVISKKKELNYKVSADYGFNLSLQDWNGFNEHDVEYCYSHEGIASFFLKWPLRDDSVLDDIRSLMCAASHDELPVMVELRRHLSSKSGYTGANILREENIGQHLRNLRSILELSVETGCRICLLDISFKEEVDLINDFTNTGLIYAELMLPYYIGSSDKLSIDDNITFLGMPLVEKLNLIPEGELWDLLKSKYFLMSRPALNLSGQGVVKGSQVDNRPDEYFLLKNFLSVIFSAGVKTGKLTYNDFVAVISNRNAKLMGVYPQKGILRVGSDADVVIWDPDYKRNLYCQFLHRRGQGNDACMLEGRVEFVFVKGIMAYNGESFSTGNVSGHYLYRSPVL